MKVYRLWVSLVFLIGLLPSISHSQNYDPIFIPFEVDEIDLTNPLIGGLLAPQFESFDLDGVDPIDLIVFERNGDILLPFINHSTPDNPSYVFAPEYRSVFPKVINFVKFLDFNNDGKEDIFALSKKGSAVEVYRNTSSNVQISFELMEFNFGLGNFLQFITGGDFSNVYVSAFDIPAIVDTDNDGDLDILTFEPGGSYMYFFQNMVKEMGLPDDTLVYRLADQCWGNFFESGVNEAISLSSDRSLCSPGLQGGNNSGGLRHAGSTVTAFDGDGDGDMDLLLGDLSNDGLVYLENDPIGNDAFVIEQDLEFPANDIEAKINIYLGSFFIDIDNDGRRDLIVCPNEEFAQNENHIWYYKNVGSDEAPVFKLIQKNFLMETTLNTGRSSYPVFLDYNQDGLEDLLIGNNGIVDGSQYKISLYLYRNIGTTTEPRYTLVDDDYLGIKAIIPEFNGFLAPAVGDLDSDGDQDIIISDNRGYLFYYENNAGPGNEFTFENYVYQYKDIKVSRNGKPFIIDLDEDGLSDIVLGEEGNNQGMIDGEVVFGGLNFFKNIGAIGNPEFEPNPALGQNTEILGAVFTKTNLDINGASSPFFFKSEDELILAVGSQRGAIHIYNDIIGNIYDRFNKLADDLPILKVGDVTNITFSDIDNDDYYEVVIGSQRGGLMAFNTEFRVIGNVATDDTAQTNFKIHPNPVLDYLQIEVDVDFDIEEFYVTSVNGQILKKGEGFDMDSRLNVSDLIPGVYCLTIVSSDKLVSRKFVKI